MFLKQLNQTNTYLEIHVGAIRLLSNSVLKSIKLLKSEVSNRKFKNYKIFLNQLKEKSFFPQYQLDQVHAIYIYIYVCLIG